MMGEIGRSDEKSFKTDGLSVWVDPEGLSLSSSDDAHMIWVREDYWISQNI